GEWDGEWADGLFGHWTLLVPDLSGDGLADVIIAAPHAPVKGLARGAVVARSPKTGAELWKRMETESENLGWDLTAAGDFDGDGRVGLFVGGAAPKGARGDLGVGAPAQKSGRVYLLSGKDGSVLRTYEPSEEHGSFGWYVARLDDLDGDGHADLAVGGPYSSDGTGKRVGGVWVISSATGKELHHWQGTDPRGAFASVLAELGDLDGDGKGEIAVAAPATEDQTWTLPGEVHVYSGATGKELRHWSGRQPGEQYGRMVVDAGD